MRDPADFAAFHAATGVATAVDETLDALLAADRSGTGPGGLPGSGQPWTRELDALQAAGAMLAAVVIKPGAVGGFEAAAAVARWAARAGVQERPSFRDARSDAHPSSALAAFLVVLGRCLEALHSSARTVASALHRSRA